MAGRYRLEVVEVVDSDLPESWASRQLLPDLQSSQRSEQLDNPVNVAFGGRGGADARSSKRGAASRGCRGVAPKSVPKQRYAVGK